MWKKLSQKYLLQTPYLSVRQDEIELPNGDIVSDYLITERKNVALIVALTTDNQILIKSEYRYPLDTLLWELPGGTFSESESPLDCAKRELLEETGYISEDWKLLTSFYEYPTKDTYQVFIYLAKAVEKVSEPLQNPMEVIDYQWIDLAKAKEMILNNEIKVAGSMIGILMSNEVN